MSERFKYYFPSQIIKDKQSGERYYGNKPLSELLNELHEENKQLKKTISMYSDATKSDMREIKELMQDIEEIEKENEQLKKELKVYRKLASCSNCDYHNYDWFDDGDEFEVCDKGNDVTEGICEEWEELE